MQKIKPQQMTTAIHIDFETRSAVDLKRSTTHAYAQDPSTDVWCMAYAVGDGPVELWKMGEPFPVGLILMMDSPDYCFIAHNAAFEYVIWNEIMHKRHGWPELPLSRLHCTMAMAYAMSMPGSLENAALAVGLTERKDLEGRRLMLQMASPRRCTPDGMFEWWDSPDKRDRLYQYCINDVSVERQLDTRVLDLKPRERAVWLIDQTINNRGVPLDIRSIRKALATVEKEKERLDKRMQKATGGYVGSTRSVQDLTDFVVWINGINTDGLPKAEVARLLENEMLPPAVREALLTRQEAAKSSTAKLQAMLDGSSRDQRVRGVLQYHGAGTGRWAGRKIQPQNMPRPKLDQDSIEDAIKNIGDTDYLEAMYGKPLQVISDCLRGMIKAPEGKHLISADYANIEGRMLAWLAGEEWKLDAFRQYDLGQCADVYLLAAQQIYGFSTVDEAKPYRQVGKTAELALGYQGGVGAFQTMAKGYGVDMQTAFSALYNRATPKQLNKAESMWTRYANKKGWVPTAPREEFERYMAAELTKQYWREAHPATTSYWYALEEAAKQAVRNKGQIFAAGPDDHRQIRFKMNGSFLFMRLPSGRNICYPYPSIKEITPPWADADSDEKRPALTYMGVDSLTKQWKRQVAYGGMIAENATQGAARDVLVEGIFQLEERLFDVIFHVHDEVVAEIQAENPVTLEEFEDLMIPKVEWTAGCPIVAEGWRGERYRK